MAFSPGKILIMVAGGTAIFWCKTGELIQQKCFNKWVVSSIDEANVVLML
jgi:hypothetical protein